MNYIKDIKIIINKKDVDTATSIALLLEDRRFFGKEQIIDYNNYDKKEDTINVIYLGSKDIIDKKDPKFFSKECKNLSNIVYDYLNNFNGYCDYYSQPCDDLWCTCDPNMSMFKLDMSFLRQIAHKNSKDKTILNDNDFDNKISEIRIAIVKGREKAKEMTDIEVEEYHKQKKSLKSL